MLTRKPRSIAIIGAGMAGSVCAQALTSAGHRVQVFDKSRGPGGRLATRRLEWLNPAGETLRAAVDHGAAGFQAHSEAFRTFIQHCVAAGCVAEWAPVQAENSRPLTTATPLYLPTPDMPALCRHLLTGIETRWSCAVDSLYRNRVGWQLGAGREWLPNVFDAVLLAVPPAQAATLLDPHHSDWAETAARTPMLPCWTLMGVATTPRSLQGPTQAWDLARPPEGPLGWIVRSDRRPGRIGNPGRAHWVVHADADWSQEHLEQDPLWVREALSAALGDYLGETVQWEHCVAHRWRYALPPGPDAQADAEPPHWWDAVLGLGVCGDFLGHIGVEGAFLSARSLTAQVLGPAVGSGVESNPLSATCPALPAHEEQTHRAAEPASV